MRNFLLLLFCFSGIVVSSDPVVEQNFDDTVFAEIESEQKTDKEPEDENKNHYGKIVNSFIFACVIAGIICRSVARQSAELTTFELHDCPICDETINQKSCDLLKCCANGKNTCKTCIKKWFISEQPDFLKESTPCPFCRIEKNRTDFSIEFQSEISEYRNDNINALTEAYHKKIADQAAEDALIVQQAQEEADAEAARELDRRLNR